MLALGLTRCARAEQPSGRPPVFIARTPRGWAACGVLASFPCFGVMPSLRSGHRVQALVESKHHGPSVCVERRGWPVTDRSLTCKGHVQNPCSTVGFSARFQRQVRPWFRPTFQPYGARRAVDQRSEVEHPRRQHAGGTRLRSARCDHESSASPAFTPGVQVNPGSNLRGRINRSP